MKQPRTKKQRWKLDIEIDRGVHVALQRYANDNGHKDNKRTSAEAILVQVLKRKGYLK